VSTYKNKKMNIIENRKVIVLERLKEEIFLVKDLENSDILEMRISGKQRMNNLFPKIGEEVILERITGDKNGRLYRYRKN